MVRRTLHIVKCRGATSVHWLPTCVSDALGRPILRLRLSVRGGFVTIDSLEPEVTIGDIDRDDGRLMWRGTSGWAIRESASL